MVQEINQSYSESPNVVVAGDVVIDWLQYSSPWKHPKSLKIQKENGGALHLADMITAAIHKDVITYDTKNEDILSNYTTHSISNLAGYQVHKEDKSKIVYRRQYFAGNFEPLKDEHRQLEIKSDNKNVDYVILNDQGYGFCSDYNLWPKAIKEKCKKPIVILKLSSEYKNNSKYDEMNCDITKGNMCINLIEQCQNNLIVITNAKYLRGENVKISRHLSWEKTAEEFMWQITHNPNIEHLFKCRNLIVRLGLEGVIHYMNDGKGPSAMLYYSPEYAEDDIKNKYNIDVTGTTSVFVAAFFSEIYKEFPKGINEDVMSDSDSSIHKCIQRGICTAITKSIEVFENGFAVAEESECKKDPTKLCPSYEYFKRVFNDSKSNFKYNISNILIPLVDNNLYGNGPHWKILESVFKLENENTYKNAVKQKIEDSLKDVPVAKFGGLITVDRDEIESYRSIKHLMSDYIKDNKIQIPLSIAVFGPPGSGKSYGVEQLAKVIDTKDKVRSLNFNVSQFTSINDLTNAFHKIRDLVLEGKTPLVFFDEFDAKFQDEELGWLKYFLAPMQDGVFKGGESMHPIGKAIFVFAGGTSNTFQEFSRENILGNIKNIKFKILDLENKIVEKDKEIENLKTKKKEMEQINTDLFELEKEKKLLEKEKKQLEVDIKDLGENSRNFKDKKEETSNYMKRLNNIKLKLDKLENQEEEYEKRKKKLGVETQNYKDALFEMENEKKEIEVSKKDMEKTKEELEKNENELKQPFNNAKGTDFVSRLRGYINVLGPNRMDNKDELYMIRRAILLRSLLKKNLYDIFDENCVANISDSVLRAFLMVPKYKHGLRSMEAIIRMSMLDGRKQYDPAALPSAQQMELHVDSTMFSNIMLHDVLFKKYMYNFAMDICNQRHPSIYNVTLEQSNEIAEHIIQNLLKMGIIIVPFIEESMSKLRVNEEQKWQLAERECERTISKQMNEKWALRYYNYSWSNISKDEKQLYYQYVEKIMEMVKDKFSLFSVIE